jgi:hypothetical protein
VLKKTVSRPNDRRKYDEDIAERMTGGVRVERRVNRPDDQHGTSKADAPADPGKGESRERRRPD